MLAQFVVSGSSDSANVALAVIGLLNLVVLIVFLVIAANVAAVRRATDIGLLGRGSFSRLCQFCHMPCPREAVVCHRCGREIGAWRMHDGAWWSRDAGGAWVRLESGRWLKPDATHAPPS
jgi:hypothetical protein